MNQHVLKYGLGLVLMLVLLGHAARFYQIPVLGNLDHIAYDTKLSLTMPRTRDEARQAWLRYVEAAPNAADNALIRQMLEELQ